MQPLPYFLAALLLLAGCRLVDPEVPRYYRSSPERFAAAILREEAPRRASVEHVGATVAPTPKPGTVADFDKAPRRRITLSEALAIAVQNADVVRAVSGSAETAATATLLDPQITETQVQAALAAFDTSLDATMFWQREENPVGSSFQGVFAEAQELDIATFRSALTKPLSTGGNLQVALNSDYLFIPFPSNSPDDDIAQHAPFVDFGISQPVFRGGGFAVNRAPLLLARAKTDQSMWDLKEALMQLVLDVEATYWTLYAAQINLRVQQELIPQSEEVARIQQVRLEAEVAVEADAAQAQAQLEEFRQRNIRAKTIVMEQEATLRNLLGLPPTGDRYLYAADEPAKAPITHDWPHLVQTALSRRPDVTRQRLAIRLQELQFLQARNALLPQVDLQGLWRINGLGEDLPDAFSVLGTSDFTDWQMGITVQIPLGNHESAASARAARLGIVREKALLKQTMHSAVHDLNNRLRQLDALYAEYESATKVLEEANKWREGARVRFENPTARTNLLVALDTYLRALDTWSRSQSEVARLLAEYCSEMTRLEQTKGTLLESRDIVLCNDPTARARVLMQQLPEAPGTEHGADLQKYMDAIAASRDETIEHDHEDEQELETAGALGGFSAAARPVANHEPAGETAMNLQDDR